MVFALVVGVVVLLLTCIVLLVEVWDRSVKIKTLRYREKHGRSRSLANQELVKLLFSALGVEEGAIREVWANYLKQAQVLAAAGQALEEAELQTTAYKEAGLAYDEAAKLVEVAAGALLDALHSNKEVVEV